MTDGVRIWARSAVRYRWFVGFGVAWLGIVTTVTPVLRPAGVVPQRAADVVRGTLGAVSSPTNAAAGAIPVAQGFDSTIGSGFDEPVGSTFDDAPLFEGFDSSDEESEAVPEPPTEDTGPAGCTTDSTLPAPVATTVVGAIAGVQERVSDATGQPLPVSPAGAVGPVLGCAESESTHRSSAPSLANGISVGGLTTADLLRILFGW
jgi:hypothetical protein